MKKALAIIPNENLLDIEPFYEDFDIEEPHGKRIRYFSDKHGLGITPSSLGLLEGEYQGYRYQVAMASLGHIVICFGEEVWAFLPEYFSVGEKDWLEEHYHFFRKYRSILYYAVVSANKSIIEARDYGSHDNRLKAMYNYVRSTSDLERKGR